MIVSCTHSFLGSVFAKDRERFLGPAPAGRQRHPTKPPHVKCRKVMGQTQHLWKSSSSLPHVLMLMHVFYWVPRLTFVRVGIPLWFPSRDTGEVLANWPSRVPRPLCDSTHTWGRTRDGHTSPCPGHHVTCAFLQKMLTLSSCVEFSLDGGEDSSFAARCLWREGSCRLGVWVQTSVSIVSLM